MTPYRYFRDKEDILAAVRANGFNRFAESLEIARERTPGDARTKSAAVGEAYLDFAFQHPNTYKLMFDLNQPHEADYPELVEAGDRARATMSAYVEDLLAEGELVGDPEQIGMMFWAATHGAVVLELAGKLPQGAARTLAHSMISSMARGLQAG
jgi:AcrR family transcriptional regulator